MNFDGWITVDFPHGTGVVYVFYATKDGKEIPFYVGQTGSFVCRMADYSRAHFDPPTDFNVGEAVKYLRDQKSYQIKVKFGRSSDLEAERLKDEDKIKQGFLSENWLLLNNKIGYDPKVQDKDIQQKRVQDLCDDIIRNSANRS
jgi:hypothetical protein